MPIRAVCFDLDGTLLRDDHGEEVIRRVAVRLAERHPGVEPDALLAANARVWAEYWPEVGEAWMSGSLPGDDVPREVWRRALAEVGVTDPDAAQAAHALHVEMERDAFALYPETLSVLAQLRERGIRTAVITNGPSGLQRAKLAAVGIADAFDAVVVSGEVGVAKPDPGIFAVALDALGAAAEEALHIGDNQIADVAGARDAGLTAVWVDRVGAERTEEAHAVVTDLNGLLALL